MSDLIIVAIIAALPPSIIGIANALSLKHHGKKMDEIHVQINSRMDQFLKAVRAEGHAEGKAEGVNDERGRNP